MDEYTFIALARLKADRLRLEREQRLAAPISEPEAEQVETHRRSARAQSFWVGFASESKWRQQS